MVWRIEFDAKAEKAFGKLNQQARRSIFGYLKDNVLSQEHPTRLGKALSKNKKGLWRYRVEKFRIICRLYEDRLVVLVVKVAKRDIVYED